MMKSRSPSIPRKSVKAISNGNTAPSGFPYLNEYHKRHSEAVMADISNQPSVSAKEAYEQYDRLTHRKDGKKSTPSRQKPIASGQ